MAFSKLEELELKEKRVFVRVDFNCPVKEGIVTDDTRIRASLPTIKFLIKNNAKVILASHLGRPKGKPQKEFSLEPVGARLAELLNAEIFLTDDCVGDGARKVISDLRPGQVALLENVRFHKEETDNEELFAKKLASFADVYINDAFGTAHRAHASTVGMAEFVPVKAPGFLMRKEIESLTPLLKSPGRPYLAILGGAKVSDKIAVLDNLLDHVNAMLVGGGMAYTFLKTLGQGIGNSLFEKDSLEAAEKILKGAKARKIALLLPVDHVISADPKDGSDAKTVEHIPDGMMGLDIGPKTRELFAKEIARAKTIFWNGPMGVFETPAFAEGTMEIARAVAGSGAMSVVGGGDSVAAVNKAGVADRIGHISTGGGASLEFMEGKQLPGIEVLDV
ncbi:MAG: phosphoglycerate kinase [Myxococcales bacterium]|nr:MAG: phosphoglycerate kinase [Myxococcales bacterium]